MISGKSIIRIFWFKTAICFLFLDSEATCSWEKPIVLFLDFAEVKPPILIPVIFIPGLRCRYLLEISRKGASVCSSALKLSTFSYVKNSFFY